LLIRALVLACTRLEPELAVYGIVAALDLAISRIAYPNAPEGHIDDELARIIEDAAIRAVRRAREIAGKAS
jgi:hypothetical protein